MALRAGDIIFTGTPEGVILGYPKNKQVWLNPGDKIACGVEKLGELRFGLVGRSSDLDRATGWDRGRALY
jgi:2-keto-4-pentenoate hydratase/2-oxohepta-3-ene-1,7-dioic acid hydratase in catechol pathway